MRHDDRNTTHLLYCGEPDDWMTVAMIRLFEGQKSACERFEKKHKKEPVSYLFVCPQCENESPNHAENSYKKYGWYQ